MYCRKCGKIISEDSNFCPYCGVEKVAKQNHPEIIEPNNPFIDLTFILSIISLAIAIFAFHEILMIIGIIIGIISLVAGIIMNIKISTKKATRAIIFSIAGILANLSWLVFTIIIF